MASYIWAIGFDWNETRASLDPNRKTATMSMSFGNTLLAYGKNGYPIDAGRSTSLDLRLFDRTQWQKGKVPTAESFRFRNFLIRFEKGADAKADQTARSPVGSITDEVDLVGSYLDKNETTPCFPNEVSGHAWDFGDYAIVHDGCFELTITFEVSVDGQSYRPFQKDPEMVVTGVSG